METTYVSPVTADADTSAPAPTAILGDHMIGVASPRDFADGIRAVILAASKDGARPILTGVLIGRNPDRVVGNVGADGKGEYVPAAADQLTMVATDSYRLHRIDVTVGDELAAMFAEPVLLPAADLANVAKLFGKRGTVATVTVTDPSAAERGADAVADLDAATTSADVERVTHRYFAGERRRTVTFASTYDGTSITVRELEGDYPKWENLVPVLADCQPSTAAFNPDYLAAVCKGASLVADAGTPMRVHGNTDGSGNRPCLFTSARDGLAFTGLLMPVRVP